MFRFNLGEEVREIVTGFSGIIMVRSEYFTGCRHYGVQSRKINSDGKLGDWEYFDESRLELVSKGVVFGDVQILNPSPRSGPEKNPPSMG